MVGEMWWGQNYQIHLIAVGTTLENIQIFCTVFEDKHTLHPKFLLSINIVKKIHIYTKKNPHTPDF